MIDAADLLPDPQAYLRRLCDHTGVEFTDRMVHWPGGPRASDGVWAPYWYDAVLASTGFEPYRPRTVQLDGAAREAADRSRPHFERLYAARLRLYRCIMADDSRHVFVSYTHDQGQVGDALVNQFRESGAAPSSIDEGSAGEGWRTQLNETVADADSFVVVIGNDPSRLNRAEWTAVLEESWADPDKPVVAILGADATLPPAFADRQAITLVQGDDISEQVDHLVPEILAAFKSTAQQSSGLDVANSWGERLDAIQFASQAGDEEAAED